MVNNFTVDNIITGGMTQAAMLAASGYSAAAASRHDIYRPSCTQPIVSQPYPTPTGAAPQTVFPSPAAEDIYNARLGWYNPSQDMTQTSPVDYQQQQQQQQPRFDNRSPSCAQPVPTFRDAYKYGYDCKY